MLHRASKLEACPKNDKFAVCSPGGLLVYNAHIDFNILLCMDDAECLDIVWSPFGTFLACIRQEDEPAVPYVLLIRIDRHGTIDSNTLPHSSQRLPKSQHASLLSFSPYENWLIVGKSQSSAAARICLYNLHDGQESRLICDPEFLNFAVGDCFDDDSAKLTSLVWTSDERFFFVHLEGSDELNLYARFTSDNFQRLELDEQLDVDDQLDNSPFFKMFSKALQLKTSQSRYI